MGDSPWNTNSFRDNGHRASVGTSTLPTSTRSLEVSFLSPFRINPIRAEGKGGSTPASTTSLDKFIHNLFADFVNRDFDKLIPHCDLSKYALNIPGKFLRVVDGTGLRFGRLFFGNRI